jgi:O-acetyl-ADP-ribose deacetylase (regulator of RNase III)
MFFCTSGDIFRCFADALVNPVNCIGVDGAGLALAFAERYPRASREYRRACHARALQGGTVFLSSRDSPTIVFLPTKTEPYRPSNYLLIDTGLRALRNAAQTRRWKSLAIPALGCGLGGLCWSKVRRQIVEILGDLAKNMDVFVFEPR